VRDVWLLERIADGLGIPRAWMGLSYVEQGLDPSSGKKEVDEEMKRRALLAATWAAALGQTFLGLGELTELALPTGQALPSRLDMSHVHAVRAVTHRLVGVARYYGGQADLFGAAATLYTRWLQVPAIEAVKAQLATALAELHTEAGWSCYDSGVDGTGYFIRALRVAGEAGDPYGVANAAFVAGGTLVRAGHPQRRAQTIPARAIPPPWVRARQDYTGNPACRGLSPADSHRVAEPQFRNRLRRHERPR